MSTPIAKTGNGAVSGGKINNLLLLGTMNGENGNDGKRYLVKGIRGMINHSMMALAKKQGIEICHSSDKEETQSGEKLLPEGFHPNGACYPENECIRHRIMGSINKISRVKFEPVVIVSTYSKEKNGDAQKVHIATETRNSLTYKSKRAIQDFGGRYFSGEITARIEFNEELTEEELGFLLKAILYVPELGLGGSINNGAGKIELLEIALQEVTRTRTVVKGKVIDEEKTKNLWKQMEEALEAW
ncbi:MAG: RAMP superfamily CRISPR-associated protein [Candidatus Heimdallarchaeota archaeon]